MLCDLWSNPCSVNLELYQNRSSLDERSPLGSRSYEGARPHHVLKTKFECATDKIRNLCVHKLF